MKRVLKSALLILFITTLIVAFQNCSIQQNTGLLGSNLSQAEIAQNIAANAPFAFDMSADTISYNSCVGDGLIQYGIHGLKIGASGSFVDTTGNGNVKSGLKLTTPFLTYAAASMTPSYPSAVVTPGQIAGLLKTSTINQEAYLQFAVRQKNDLSIWPDIINPGASGYTVQITAPRDGYIDSNMIWQDPVASNLAKYVQYNTDGTIVSEGRRVSNLGDTSNPQTINASFSYSNYTDTSYPLTNSSGDVENLGYGELYAENIRQKFNSANPNKLILTQTYGSNSTSNSSSSPLSSPLRVKDQETSLNKAYGRAYQLTFSAISTTPGWLKTLLTTVAETDLATGQAITGTSWQCSSFIIMKQDQWDRRDAIQPLCAPLIASDMVNAGFAASVQALRRHYSTSDWNIGLFYDAGMTYDSSQRTSRPICLVPKNAECYLPTNVGGIDSVIPGGVQYNTNQECYLYNHSGVSYAEPTDTASLRARGRCAQYASICVRTTTGN